MIFLERQEYAKIISEINTDYSIYIDKKIAAHLSYGTDDKAYVYIFENHGFNNYIFIARDELS